MKLDIDCLCLCQATPDLSVLFCGSVADGKYRHLEGVCLQTKCGANKLRRLVHVLTLAAIFKQLQKIHILPIFTLRKTKHIGVPCNRSIQSKYTVLCILGCGWRGLLALAKWAM